MAKTATAMDRMITDYHETLHALRQRLEQLNREHARAQGTDARSLARRMDVLQQEIWQCSSVLDWMLKHYAT